MVPVACRVQAVRAPAAHSHPIRNERIARFVHAATERPQYCMRRCLEFLAQHIAEFSLQHDASDTACTHADVALARVWLAATPHATEDASCADNGASSTAATYAVAYDQAFSCPVSFLHASVAARAHSPPPPPQGHAVFLQPRNHRPATASRALPPACSAAGAINIAAHMLRRQHVAPHCRCPAPLLP